MLCNDIGYPVRLFLERLFFTVSTNCAMEKIRLLRRSPLFASTFVFSASFRIYPCPKQRLLSSVGSNRTEGQPAKKQSGMYPGVPVFELTRAWFLYNLFRSNYLVDNGLQVNKQLHVMGNGELMLCDVMFRL